MVPHKNMVIKFYIIFRTEADLNSFILIEVILFIQQDFFEAAWRVLYVGMRNQMFTEARTN